MILRGIASLGVVTGLAGVLFSAAPDPAEMTVPVANADEVLRPDPRSPKPTIPDPGSNKMHPRWATHPRYARIIPKSRDFH